METSARKPKILGPTLFNRIDRISSLPDDVLHYILSYLSIFDVAELSLLSKRWQYIWSTLPYFRFDLNSVYLERRKWPSVVPTSERFKDFINWSFISQSPVKLVRFILCCGGSFDKVAISRWIHATVKRNVQQLVLEFRLCKPFELPYSLATCESLQVLKLHLSNGILKLPNHFGFCQLKLLHLQRVELSDEHLTSCLFSSCHLLEKLILQDCSLGTMTLLDIASTSLLYGTIQNDNNYVETYDNCIVKMSCPSLKVFKYRAPKPKDIIIENLFLVEVFSIFFIDMPGSDEENGVFVHKMIKEVPSTSALKLSKNSVWVLYEATQRLRLPPLSFCKLKYLRLEVNVDEHFMQVMILLLKASPNLEVLKLWSDENGGWSDNWQLHDPDESIACLESHLKSIQLTDFKDEENERELIRFFLKNAQVLEKLTIVWATYADKSEEASDEVSKFPRTSSHVVLTFHDAKPWSSKRSRY